MATNPTVPYSELVSNAAEGDPTVLEPVGVTMENPFVTQQAWDAMMPTQQADYIANLVTGGLDPEGDGNDAEGDGGDGNFTVDSHLDSSQVEGSAPPMAPVGMRSQGDWRDQVQAPAQDIAERTIAPLEKTIDNYDALGHPETPKEARGGLGGYIDDVREGLSAMIEGRDADFKNNARPGALPVGDEPIPTVSAIGAPTTTGSGSVPTMGDFAGVPGSVDAGEPQVVTASPAEQAKPAASPYATDDQDFAARVSRSALNALRRPVVWGGETEDGMSMVGLVRNAYGNAGREMRPFEEQMIESGDQVPLAKAKSGDLVVNEKGKVVGLYMANGKFVGPADKQFALRDKDEFKKDSLHAVRVHSTAHTRTLADLSDTERRTVADFNKGVESMTESLSHMFSGGKKKSTSRKSSSSSRKRSSQKRSSRKRSNSDRSGRGSKYYGSDKKHTGNSSHKYSGIGATK